MSADARTIPVPRPGQPRRRAGPAWWTRTPHAANDDPAAALGPETHIPDDALAASKGLPLDDQLQTLLAGAVRLGESTERSRAYNAGYADGRRGEWWWGVVCGATASALLITSAFGAGYHWGLL